MQLEIPTKNVYSWWERQTPFIFIQSHEVCRCFAAQWIFKTDSPFYPLFFPGLSLLSVYFSGYFSLLCLFLSRVCQFWGMSIWKTWNFGDQVFSISPSSIEIYINKLLINLENNNTFVQPGSENKRQAAAKISGVVVAEAQFLQHVAEGIPSAI